MNRIQKLYFISSILFLSLNQCGAVQKYRASKLPNLHSMQIEHNGKNRTYHVYSPSKMNSNMYQALVLVLHGRFGSGIQVMYQTEFNKIADDSYLLIIYPDGYGKSWADGRGGTPADLGGIDDVAFLEKLLQIETRRYKLDPNKVFIMGHSNGGFMTQRMLLERTELFRAGASVVSQISVNLAKKYKPQRPINVLFLNGTEDPLVPYYGGYVSDLGEILSVNESFHKWVEWNGCKNQIQLETFDRDPLDKTKITIMKSESCSNNTKVLSYSIMGGGHNYPGKQDNIPFVKLGEPTFEIDATKIIWDFFKSTL